MTDSMIERVAKVFEADDRISPFMARRLAREAIEAMRQPTVVMLERGRGAIYDCAVHDGYGGVETSPPVAVWEKMIDAALEPVPA